MRKIITLSLIHILKKIIIALLMIFAAFVFSANIIRPKADDEMCIRDRP